MAKNSLSPEQVKAIKADNVHDIVSRTMLADGMPIVVDFEKSHGNYLFDSKGQKYYLDFFSYFASWALGHNHPKMNDPEFIKKISRIAVQNPSNSDIYTIEMAQFVATFERVAMTDDFKYLFFISGGALAVENAIKAAQDWKIRKNIAAGNGEIGQKIIHFQQAFHGRTGYTLSLTNTFDPRKTQYFEKFNWPRFEIPKVKFPLTEENTKAVEEAEKRVIGKIEETLRTGAVDVAGILIEPIQGESGDNHFRAEFFKELRRLADQYDVMLIFDEIQSGLGITGKMWAYEHFGIVPDILCFGKKTQVCGIMVTDRIDEVKDNVFHVSSRINSTWGGNLTDMVRAQRIMEIIEEDNLVENAAIIGEYLLEKLNALAEVFPDKVSNVRGRGLMTAFDLPDTETRNTVREKAFDKGLIILQCGANTIRFRPALICDKTMVDRMTAILHDILMEI